MEQRLIKAGLHDVRTVCQLDLKQMRRAWGSVWGERMWYYLRGLEVAEEETVRSSLGHSHVLAPEMRPPDKARYVARRLTLKAASRLRRMGYVASAMSLSARIEQGARFETMRPCWQANDSLTFLHLLDDMWRELTPAMKTQRLKKVSVNFYRLTDASQLQPELFGTLPEDALRARAKAERMSRALDKINHRYGRDTVVLGMTPEQGRSFTGTKIAFTRIPDKEEFLE